MSDFVTWTLFIALGLAAFAFFEYRALAHADDPKRVTLSRYVYTIGAKFPLSIFLAGMVIGSLATHLWWHWCPAGAVTGG